MELAPFNPSSNLLFLVKDNKRAMLDQISSIKTDQDQKGDSLTAASKLMKFVDPLSQCTLNISYYI